MKMTRDYCLLECEAKQVMDMYRTHYDAPQKTKFQSIRTEFPNQISAVIQPIYHLFV